jgi:hypothetical protein
MQSRQRPTTYEKSLVQIDWNVVVVREQLIQLGRLTIGCCVVHTLVNYTNNPQISHLCTQQARQVMITSRLLAVSLPHVQLNKATTFLWSSSSARSNAVLPPYAAKWARLGACYVSHASQTERLLAYSHARTYSIGSGVGFVIEKKSHTWPMSVNGCHMQRCVAILSHWCQHESTNILRSA